MSVRMCCGTNEPKNKFEESRDEVLKEEAATKFRSIAARLNFLALDRAGLQYAAKCICKRMASPVQSSWDLLRRAGRYLKGKSRVVQKFPWSKRDDHIRSFADSDWAGSRGDATSTPGGAIQWGPHTLKIWATSQRVVAMSSGEAEFYAATRSATQLFGLINILEDLGI